MLTPPPVIINQAQASLEEQPEATAFVQQKAELYIDRFPLAALAQQGRDSEILMLGGAPLGVILAVFAAMVSAHVIKFFSERNEIGINMRSSECER
jgi:cellobiose-specific phosphotransferase system component IIC